MSGHSTEERVADVIFDARRRRTRADKEAILAELKADGATVSAVARRHNVAPSLVFRWRRELALASGETRSGPGRFVPVMLAPPGTARGGKPGLPAGSGIIEIELAGGRRIRVDGSADMAALRRVIDVLERRAVCRSLGEGR